MKQVHLLFAGLAILLLGTSAAFGQIFSSPCEQAACDPCEQVACDPCDPVCGSKGFFGSAFIFGGWVDSGVYTNSHGFNNNGPQYTSSKRRNDVILNQLYLYTEKEMNTKHGFDWGAKAALVYGAHAGSMQTYDGSFDSGWGDNKHGYAMSAYNVYGTLGYKDLSVKIGKFTTAIGWEGSASQNNFFYSHSYCYMIEPATHMGVVADYALTDRLTLTGGWTTGMDSSFANPDNNHAFLGGFEYALTDKANVYYYINAGRQNDWWYLDDSMDANYFVQSICFEWEPTDRFTYVLQYNLHNANGVGGGARKSAYGINNHFLYKLSSQWGVGTRFEWMRDNGDFFTATPTDYYQVTFGLNWSPRKNVSIRPEVRYDWAKGATPFGNAETFGGHPAQGIYSDQFSGGLGVVVSF